MKFYNSLTRKEEVFEALKVGKVGVYTCGPTVYSYVTIGNWRTYVLGDVVVRGLKYLGYEVDYVMNVTDVGHLTGDNLGDADTGEDRLEKAAIREGKTAWDIARFYTQDFLEGYEKLGLTKPKIFCKATDHIDEQIELVERIEQKGLAYRISDGVYFDTRAYEADGNIYGELSNIDQIKEGARVEPNPEKRDPRDFALWKFSPKGEKRQMEWESPWGIGFPGWHIECSAMSMKFLGEQFDIHVGGEDLKSTHHPNEIAQSEAATGKKPFVKYWLHGAFLQVDGKRMGKSLGNAYTLHTIEEWKVNPMALKLFYYSGHYSKPLNFTKKALLASQNSLNNLYDRVRKYKSAEKEAENTDRATIDKLEKSFKGALEKDLQMPVVLAVVWDVIKANNLAESSKLSLLLKFDKVLGLGLNSLHTDKVEVPWNVQKLLELRAQLKSEKKFAQADKVREQIRGLGFEIEDTSTGSKVIPS